jgi:sugar diacid utilization regulator
MGFYYLPADDLQKYIKGTGIQVNGEYVLVIIRSKNQKQVLLHPYMRFHFQSKSLPILMYAAEDTLFVLVYDQGRCDTRSRVLQEIFNLSEGLQAMCGVSRCFDNLIKVKVYCEQALSALESGYQINPDRFVFYFDDYYLPVMLSKLRENLNPENCIHPAIFKLEAFDRENRTDYLKTLKTSVEHLFDSNAVCQKLHIHRNTHLYRMNKIKELTGIDYENSVTCAELLISFNLMDLMEHSTAIKE